MDSPSSSAAAAAAPAASTADPPSSSPSLARSSSSSPDPTNPSPSLTSSPPAATGTADPAPPSTSSSHRRVPPPCWSTEETIALIDAYQDKWYSLRRGNLRASDWQDVADAVAARAPRRLTVSAAANPLSSPASSSAAKTAVQCRHKVEKLRKRYRAERQRSLKRQPRAPPKSSWEFFRKMHAMETGGPPLPQPAKKGGGAAAGMAGSGPQARRGTGPGPTSSSDDNDENSNNIQHRLRHTRPLNGLMMMTTTSGPGGGAARHGGGAPAAAPPAGFRFKVPKAVRTKLLSPRGEAAAMASRHQGSSRPFGAMSRHQMPSTHGFAEMRNRLLEKKRKHRAMQLDDDDDHQAAAHSGGIEEVAEAVRMLGDGFMRMERMKMDMAMQIHRLRMETEMKRTQMMLDSNRKIVDMMLGGGVNGASNKRTKASS